ncbi:MAG: hypothetical protein B7Y43_03150 [Sphingomonas sp. 28-62-20]|nr:MAG: hypothetical protein B7Y43_03150 [Sphingomonas sp. 28-62-20]
MAQMPAFQIGETGGWGRFEAICDTSAMPDGLSAFFIKATPAVQTDHFSCHQRDHRSRLVGSLSPQRTGGNAEKYQRGLSGHQCAEADICFELGAVAAVDPDLVNHGPLTTI